MTTPRIRESKIEPETFFIISKIQSFTYEQLKNPNEETIQTLLSNIVQNRFKEREKANDATIFFGGDPRPILKIVRDSNQSTEINVKEVHSIYPTLSSEQTIYLVKQYGYAHLDKIILDCNQGYPNPLFKKTQTENFNFGLFPAESDLHKSRTEKINEEKVLSNSLR
jgi:hypothetical protein